MSFWNETPAESVRAVSELSDSQIDSLQRQTEKLQTEVVEVKRSKQNSMGMWCFLLFQWLSDI